MKTRVSFIWATVIAMTIFVGIGTTARLALANDYPSCTAPGQNIFSATFTICFSGAYSDETVNLYRITAPWFEDEVTWDNFGGYDGGPMFYLKKVFKSNVLPILIAILLAIYGTEIYMFNVMVDAMHTNCHLHKYLAITLLLIAIIYAGGGGVSRVGKICSFIIPLFLILFVFMGGYVIYRNSHNIVNTFAKIFYYAFNGHAAAGGFAG